MKWEKAEFERDLKKREDKINQLNSKIIALNKEIEEMRLNENELGDLENLQQDDEESEVSQINQILLQNISKENSEF